MRLVLSSLLSLLASLFVCAAACADSIGVFSVVTGEVQLLRGESYLAAARGVEVQSDDIVESGKGASAQLDMEDGSVLKLGPETRLALSDYKLDANKNVVSASLDVLSGWLRFAVAKLKPEGRYNFNTPVLTIGVRGTEGTIEAENEQGGLHLEEGAVDVTPFGADLPTLPPVRVVSGEFIQRARGQQLAKLPQPPARFKNRLPPVVQQKLQRRALELKERGVPPKVIRQITREDAKRFVERHPHLKEKLRERFQLQDGKPPLAPGKGGDARPLKERETGPAPGAFGGQVLRERQLKGDAAVNPKEFSEAMRRRSEQKQLEQSRSGTVRPDDKLAPSSIGLPPKQAPATTTAPMRLEKPLAPIPSPTEKPPLTTSPTVTKPLLTTPLPTTQQAEEPATEATKPATSLQPLTSPLLLQRTAPATTTTPAK